VFLLQDPSSINHTANPRSSIFWNHALLGVFLWFRITTLICSNMLHFVLNRATRFENPLLLKILGPVFTCSFRILYFQRRKVSCFELWTNRTRALAPLGAYFHDFLFDGTICTDASPNNDPRRICCCVWEISGSFTMIKSPTRRSQSFLRPFGVWILWSAVGYITLFPAITLKVGRFPRFKKRDIGLNSSF